MLFPPSPTTPPTNSPSRTLPRRQQYSPTRTGRVSISERLQTYTYAIRVRTLLRRRMQTRSYLRVIPSREHLRVRRIHILYLRVLIHVFQIETHRIRIAHTILDQVIGRTVIAV